MTWVHKIEREQIHRRADYWDIAANLGRSARCPCWQNGIWDAAFYKWRSKFGGMNISDARQLQIARDQAANAAMGFVTALVALWPRVQQAGGGGAVVGG